MTNFPQQQPAASRPPSPINLITSSTRPQPANTQQLRRALISSLRRLTQPTHSTAQLSGVQRSVRVVSRRHRPITPLTALTALTAHAQHVSLDVKATAILPLPASQLNSPSCPSHWHCFLSLTLTSRLSHITTAAVQQSITALCIAHFPPRCTASSTARPSLHFLSSPAHSA